MIFLVFCWGFDYVPAKWALEMMSPSAVVLYKYVIGLLCVLIIKIATGNRNIVRKKDIPIIICIAGVALVIGADLSIIFQGRGLGYILAIGAVLCWNIYNFIFGLDFLIRVSVI